MTDGQGNELPIFVLHLASGQTVIGIVTMGGSAINVDHPCEIMVTPNTETQHPQVALMRYGSMYETIPELAASQIRVDITHAMSAPIAPPPGLLNEYIKVLARITAPLKPAQTTLEDKHGSIEGKFEIRSGG